MHFQAGFSVLTHVVVLYHMAIIIVVSTEQHHSRTLHIAYLIYLASPGCSQLRWLVA